MDSEVRVLSGESVAAPMSRCLVHEDEDNNILKNVCEHSVSCDVVGMKACVGEFSPQSYQQDFGLRSRRAQPPSLKLIYHLRRAFSHNIEFFNFDVDVVFFARSVFMSKVYTWEVFLCDKLSDFI